MGHIAIDAAAEMQDTAGLTFTQVVVLKCILGQRAPLPSL